MADGVGGYNRALSAAEIATVMNGGGGGGGSWTQTSETRYVYDGRRVIQERDGNNTPTVSYTRGLDLSGTLGGAGGIGGLIARTDNLANTHALYHADGNGNITALIDNTANPTAMAASYGYGPFGNIVSQSGSLASANVYRFSSKEFIANPGCCASRLRC